MRNAPSKPRQTKKPGRKKRTFREINGPPVKVLSSEQYRMLLQGNMPDGW